MVEFVGKKVMLRFKWAASCLHAGLVERTEAEAFNLLFLIELHSIGEHIQVCPSALDCKGSNRSTSWIKIISVKHRIIFAFVPCSFLNGGNDLYRSLYALEYESAVKNSLVTDDDRSAKGIEESSADKVCNDFRSDTCTITKQYGNNWFIHNGLLFCHTN